MPMAYLVPMADDQKTTRIIIPMKECLVSKIDEWRYANRVPARAEAIRRLIETALNTPTMPRRPK
jgi:metal-responsive CopG/Arc/MetJ family transcriptional regulator